MKHSEEYLAIKGVLIEGNRFAFLQQLNATTEFNQNPIINVLKFLHLEDVTYICIFPGNYLKKHTFAMNFLSFKKMVLEHLRLEFRALFI